mgnify:FL=1
MPRKRPLVHAAMMSRTSSSLLPVLGKARDLVLGGIRRDLRVEAGPRTRHQVDGYSVHIGIGVGGADLLRARIYQLPILLTRRGQVGRGTIRHELAAFAFDD